MDISESSILIVERDDIGTTSISSLLGKVGAKEVDTCFIDEATSFLSKKTYHLALININLPSLSGLDLIKRIRSNGDPTLTKLFIIAMSSSDSEIVLRDSIEGGADSFLLKPISKTRLHVKTLALLRRL